MKSIYSIKLLIQAYKKTFDFKSRTGRKEFWITFLFLFFLQSFIFYQIYLGYIILYLFFVIVIPLPALACRRLNDVGGKWWMLLIILIPFPFALGFLYLLFLFAFPKDKLPKFNRNNLVKSFGIDTISVFFKKIPAIYKNAELRIQGKTRKCANCTAPLKDIYSFNCLYCGYENEV